MPVWLEAGRWGLLAGGALVVGAAAAWFVRVPPRVVAGVMAYGSGVLIAALAFELVSEANEQGGLTATAAGLPDRCGGLRRRQRGPGPGRSPASEALGRAAAE